MPIPGTITVRYTCPGCGLTDRELTVRARASADEDLGGWMKYLTRRISEDHHLTRPQCTARIMKDLKIPLVDAPDAFVGQSTA